MRDRIVDAPAPTVPPFLRKLNGPVGIFFGVILAMVGVALIAVGVWMLARGDWSPDRLAFALVLLGLAQLVNVPVGVLIVRAANRRPS